MNQEFHDENKPPFPDSFFEGLDKIKLAALVLIIGTLLSLVSLFVPAVAIVAAILVIIIVWVELIGGFRLLKESNADYGIGLTGAYGLIVAAIILFIGGISVFVLPPFGLLVVILGAVLGILAGILVAIGLFRIGSKNGSGLMEVGAVLVIFISFIGWILVYVSIGEIKNKANKRNAEQSFKSQ
ncbi:MAG: DUF973 family protein [Thermoplasmatales archaeon]|nr:DUF973 family protein [Thermoplasmatales archaeon]MCW6170101.1 DUF973 family protein [Thermoplasmatales archaeon]